MYIRLPEPLLSGESLTLAMDWSFEVPEAGAPRMGQDGEVFYVPPGSDNPAAIGPSGRVHMPMADMARYLSAHVRRDTEFLSKDSWATLHEPAFSGNYAFGWVKQSENRRWHNGSNTMWYGEVLIDFETQTVAAVCVNYGNTAEVQRPVGKLLEELAGQGNK